MSRLLLDTNVVVWLLTGNREAVSAAATEALEDSANTLFLSAVAPWEIAIKRSLGKLDIAADWAESLLGLDLEPLTITLTHARGVEDLPWYHRDPFDRLLVSQARAEDAALVTADSRLADYDVRTVW